MQWKNAHSRSFTAASPPNGEGVGANLWVGPQGDTIKVKVDAVIFTEQGAYGIGLVARDSSEGLVQAKAKLFSGNVAPEPAEVVAIKEALSLLKKK